MPIRPLREERLDMRRIGAGLFLLPLREKVPSA
jgi:hypothetical protein